MVSVFLNSDRFSSFLPLKDHLFRNRSELRVVLAVCAYFFRRILQGVPDQFEYFDELSSCTERSPFSEANKILRCRPLVSPVQRQGHSILRDIDTRRYEIVDRSQMCLSHYIVINDSKVLEMCVPIVDRAIQSDQGKEPKALFQHSG